MNRSARSLGSLFVAGVLTIGLAVPASAEDEPEAGDPGSTLSNVTDDSSSPATDVLSDVAQVATDSTGDAAIGATVAGIDVTVPTDPSDPVTLGSSTGEVISIELPFADAEADATVVAEGVVAHDNNNESSTAPVVKEDGSLQVITVIETASAPTEYAYQLDIPDGVWKHAGESVWFIVVTV